MVVGYASPFGASVADSPSELPRRRGDMSTKRQQTMAKIARERAVKEKRERKLEKKHAAAAERKAKANEGLFTNG